MAGLPAFKRYCAHTYGSLDLIPSYERFKLGVAILNSLGTAIIRVPIDNRGNYLEYVTDVVDVDIPILFGLEKMKELKWFVKEVTNEFCSYVQPKLRVKLNHFKGHLDLTLPLNYVLFTRRELLKIHRRFAHPSTAKLMA